MIRHQMLYTVERVEEVAVNSVFAMKRSSCVGGRSLVEEAAEDHDEQGHGLCGAVRRRSWILALKQRKK